MNTDRRPRLRAVRRLSAVLVVIMLGSPLVSPAAAQPTARIGEEDVSVVAGVRDGRAVATDPAGQIYVADAGPDVVRILRADGTSVQVLGGPGTDAGAFDDPSGIDPTNGLTLLVADAGNSRIQRFSENMRFMEALPVGRIDGSARAGRPVFDGSTGGQDVQGNGRPVAVATSRSDETFAIDERHGIVLKWDAARRLETAIGGFDEREGALGDPVGLAVGSRRLFVADRQAQAVKTYDLFGTFAGTLGIAEALGAGALAGLRSLTGTDGRLLVVCADRIVSVDWDGQVRRDIRVSLTEPLVGAVRSGGALYLLTETRLLRVSTS